MCSCEHFRQLMMGLLDDELTPEERTAVNDHLTRCAQCREEYQELLKQDKDLKMLSIREPEDEVLARLWKSPYNRFTRLTGLFTIMFGWVVLLLYGLYEMGRDTTTPLIPKIGIAALVIGFMILLVLVIRERFITYKIDPYREVER